MSDTRTADVVIIGGGASGLAAAVELGMSSSRLDVLVIDRMPEPGRKIRATGSGRCNITNTGAAGFSRIMEFFRETGLVTRTYDNGLVYPYSESAADVAELLTSRAEALGIRFACGEEVLTVRTEDAGSDGRRFAVTSSFKDRDGEHRVVTTAAHVILATGGKAGPGYGTTGDGYRMARELGHSIVTPVPALTSIECEEWSGDAEPCGVILGGTRSQVSLSLYRDETQAFGEDTKIFEERGELQFTRFGLSGICVFNMTRHMRYDRASGGSLADFLVRVDLFPGADIREYIRDRQEGRFSGAAAGGLLRTLLKAPLAEYVLGRAGTDPEMPLSSLRAEDIEAIAVNVHGLSFSPSQIRGWKDAQVSMGGVSLDEIYEETCESKIVPGLYITGELADRDFPCGGFNLSNAWITGLAAADSIASGR